MSHIKEIASRVSETAKVDMKIVDALCKAFKGRLVHDDPEEGAVIISVGKHPATLDGVADLIRQTVAGTKWKPTPGMNWPESSPVLTHKSFYLEDRNGYECQITMQGTASSPELYVEFTSF